MREYVISDLTPAETQGLEETLAARNLAAGIEHLYWLPVPELTAVQKEHAASCGPHVVALEVEETSLRMELLVRAKNRLRCDGVLKTYYATLFGKGEFLFAKMRKAWR